MRLFRLLIGRPHSLLLASAALIAGLSAQASAAPASGYILQGVPLVRQSYNACGPASITEVLGYFGLKVEMAQVSALTRPDDRAYMTGQAIVDFAPRVGMQARLYSGGTLNTVRSAIRSGLPIIALQDHIPEAGKVIPHWRVVVGYDDAKQAVYLMDPLLGYVGMGYADFSRVWAAQRGQFAVMYPPKLAATVKKAVG